MTVYIVDIEAVDTRYTKQWKEHLPEQMQRALVSDVAVLDEVSSAAGRAKIEHEGAIRFEVPGGEVQRRAQAKVQGGRR